MFLPCPGGSHGGAASVLPGPARPASLRPAPAPLRPPQGRAAPPQPAPPEAGRSDRWNGNTTEYRHASPPPCLPKTPTPRPEETRGLPPPLAHRQQRARVGARRRPGPDTGPPASSPPASAAQPPASAVPEGPRAASGCLPVPHRQAPGRRGGVPRCSLPSGRRPRALHRPGTAPRPGWSRSRRTRPAPKRREAPVRPPGGGRRWRPVLGTAPRSRPPAGGAGGAGAQREERGRQRWE